ncbi:MAG: hypothetical protein KY439_07855 [Actinobacteria bacterium]|nr:hypothetical protein [Actinomycetota bacterium]
MIVCTNCGNHNEDSDEFCGSCGKFLEWVGQRIEAPAPPAEVQVAPEPEPVKTGLIDRVKAAVGIDEGAHSSSPASGATAVAGPPTAGSGLLGAPPAGDGSGPGHGEEARRRAEEERAQQEAEAARRAQQEAEAKAAADAEAARRAEQEARRRAEEEARARADAERRQASEAEAARRAEEERRAVAAAEAAAAAAAAGARQAEAEAAAHADDGAAQLAAAAEAARQAEQSAAAAAALEEARRAEEMARAEAEAEARALQEAQQKAREEAEGRRAAEEQARQRAAEEARAKATAEARARDEEAARKRAAALLQRARPAPTAVPDEPPALPGSGPVAPAAVTPTNVPRPPAQQPVAQQPVAQQPSVSKMPPRPDPKVKPADKVLNAGDLVCGQCGQGNDPTRKFCRKCGNSLAQAVPAKKVPWWKKLFSPKSRVSKEAGTRGSKVRAAKEASFKVQIFLNTLRRVLMVLAFLGVAGSLAVPSTRTLVLDKGRSAFNSAQALFNPQFEPVNAVAVSASSAIPGHEAALANDLGSNTYWAEGAEGEGVGQTLSFTFENKVDLTKVIVSSGAADSSDNFLKQPRPKRLHLTFDNGGSTDILLKDQFKPQGFNLKGAKGVSTVIISISEVYKGQVGSDTAIAEVEFKKKG